MREFIINNPGWIFAAYFILSLVVYFILEYRQKPFDDDYGGNLMISMFWPILLPIAVVILPFMAISTLAKNLRERKKKKINGTSLTGKKYNGW
jgi:heme/copper-type cytochrome/quinol oxidase subunit 2